MSCFSPAGRRYQRAVILLSLGYALALIGVELFFRHHPGIHDASAYAIAVLPALPIIGIFFAIGRYLVDEQDEYLRMLLVRKTLVASAFSLSIATVWGFLQSFGLAGHVDAYWAAILWFAGLGLGSCINKLTIGRGS